jgi:hypothetical protein
MERIRVNMVISENTSQTVVRGLISVPDPKPDVEKVLSTDKTVSVKRTEVLPDKVVVEGTINIQVVYVAFEPAQSVHHFHDQLRFTTFVDVPGAMPGMDVYTNVTVEDVSIVRAKKRPRDFDVSAVLEVMAKVTEIQDLDVITQCPSGCTCDTETIDVDHVMGSNSRQVIISDVFEVPEQKPPVEKILDVDARVEITETRVLRNKVIFDGTVTLSVLYVGMLPEQPVHQLHHDFKFSNFVDVPGSMQDMDVRFNVMVEDADVDLARGHDPNELQANIVLKITANVVEPRRVNVITDIRNCNVDPTYTMLRVDSLVGEGTQQVVVKDTFSTPEPKPDVEKILETTVNETRVTEKKVLRDKIIIKGYVDVEIVYVAALPEQPVHAMHRRVHFNTFVEVMGVREGMDVDVEVDAEFLNSYYEKCHIHVEMVIKVTVRVTESMQRQIVTSTSATTTEAPTTTAPATTTPCPPGGTFDYVVLQGESLYSIGLKYGIPVQQMIDANPQLPNPADISPGMMINVPCVAKG